MTSPQRTETAVDACEREVRGWILRGDVRPGERLPPERELAPRLGVNRTTLRSALTRLITARLLRPRHGSGYVVQDVRKVAGLELIPELARDEAGVAAAGADLLRLRRALVGLALAHATAPDARLAQLATRLRDRIDDGAPCDELADVERELLAALCSAGPTPVLSLSLNSVCFAMDAMPRLREALYAQPSTLQPLVESVRRWSEGPSARGTQAVLEALAARDDVAVERLTSSAPA